MTDQVHRIPLDQIDAEALPGDRAATDPAALAKLTDSIARHGLRKAIEKVRLHGPVTIRTARAPTYRNVIRDGNRRYDPQFDSSTHIDKKWRNDRIKSDHAALKRLLGNRQNFRSLGSAKSAIRVIEAIRTIKNKHIGNKKPDVQSAIVLVHEMFDLAAQNLSRAHANPFYSD